MKPARIVSLIVIVLSAALIVWSLSGRMFAPRSFNFTIEGPAHENGATVWLYVSDEVLDSCVVTDSHFSFSGRLKSPCTASIETDESVICSQLFIERGNVRIDTAGRAWGTAGNDARRRFIAAEDSLSHLYAADIELAASMIDSLTAAHIALNRDNMCGVWLFARTAGRMDIGSRRTTLNLISKPLRNNPLLADIRNSIERFDAVQPGRKAISVTLPDTDGRMISIDSLLAEGRYVLLDFWATWDGRRDRDQMLETITAPYGEERLTVCRISIDNSRSRWRSAVEESPAQWIQLNAVDTATFRAAAAEAYAIDSLPMSYLISPDGHISLRTNDIGALKAELASLFGEKN